MLNPNSHNSLDQLLHDTYLGNQSIAETSFDIESLYVGKQPLPKQNIFITGLARSGTTSVFNYLYNANEFGSLLYSDMPFLLMPNLWNLIPKKKKSDKTERFHGDNIMVGDDSPEALDEFFWKVFLKDSYINKDSLEINKIDDDTIRRYEKYISLICRARKKEKYLSKNNNSILRLEYLLKLSNPTKVFLLYRNPIDHAASLHKLHLKFSNQQQEDKFILRYFDYLGHHEFGLHQKIFNLYPEFKDENLSFNKELMDFWLKTWIDYYTYILEHLTDQITLICFEDICNFPEKTYSYIADIASLNQHPSTPEAYTPPTYNIIKNYNTNLENKAVELYQQLNKKRKYI